jgi:hypothetical protein
MTTQTIKRRYNQYSLEFEDRICERYLQGKSSVMLQKEYKISPDTVLKIVRSRGHTPRTFKDIMTKYTFDHSFFESIDTEAKAYFLGFMLADGHVGEREVIIQLHSKDRHIIEEFIQCINGNNVISEKVNNSNFSNIKKQSMCSRLNLRSDKMILDLNALGLYRDKTYNTIIPKISEHLERHFWRGLLDGDGHISFYQSKYKTKLANDKTKCYGYKILEVGICGHINTANAFVEFLNKHNIETPGVRPDKAIYQVRVRTKDCPKFLDLIYSDSDPKLCLKRKYEKYLEYVKYKKN